MVVHRRTLDTPIGPFVVCADEAAVIRASFGETDIDPDIAEIEGPHPVLDLAATQLEEYFAGTRLRFDLPFRLEEGTSFDHDAWMALATIPYGETISYATQADRIGRSGAFRAVGAANGRNPLPVILPCHRVVGADGSLVGFGGGLPVKRALLDLESGVQQLPLG